MDRSRDYSFENDMCIMFHNAQKRRPQNFTLYILLTVRIVINAKSSFFIFAIATLFKQRWYDKIQFGMHTQCVIGISYNFDVAFCRMFTRSALIIVELCRWSIVFRYIDILGMSKWTMNTKWVLKLFNALVGRLCYVFRIEFIAWNFW